MAESSAGRAALTLLQTTVQDDAKNRPTKRQLELQKRRTTQGVRISIAAALLIALISILINIYLADRLAKLSVANELNGTSIQLLQQANEARKEVGLPPIQIPSVTQQNNEEVDVNALVQSVSAAVLTEIRSDPVFRGPAGTNGINGTNGIDGTNGEDGDEGQRGESGNEGPQGDRGPAGKGVLSSQPEAVEGDCRFITRYDDGTLTDVDTPETNCVETDPGDGGIFGS